MAQIVIEGTSTPSANLPTGQRMTVDSTDPQVQRWIKRGFVRVVADAEAAPADTITDEGFVLDEDEDDAPKRNASRDDWAEFLTGLEFTVDPDATRAQLIEAYEATREPRSHTL